MIHGIISRSEAQHDTVFDKIFIIRNIQSIYIWEGKVIHVLNWSEKHCSAHIQQILAKLLDECIIKSVGLVDLGDLSDFELFGKFLLYLHSPPLRHLQLPPPLPRLLLSLLLLLLIIILNTASLRLSPCSRIQVWPEWTTVWKVSMDKETFSLLGFSVSPDLVSLELMLLGSKLGSKFKIGIRALARYVVLKLYLSNSKSCFKYCWPTTICWTVELLPQLFFPFHKCWKRGKEITNVLSKKIFVVFM